MNSLGIVRRLSDQLIYLPETTKKKKSYEKMFFKNQDGKSTLEKNWVKIKQRSIYKFLHVKHKYFYDTLSPANIWPVWLETGLLQTSGGVFNILTLESQ